MMSLGDLYFDKGNGATFGIEYEGRIVRCFVSQSNKFLARKSGGQNFASTFERYSRIIAEAALSNIQRNGVSPDVWGNLISDTDMEIVQSVER